ncbi:probable G-protein coupled receptor 158 [Chanos chanos]|uniref:Probable G-protein coupled receptor 158 n=1 Tax=Chanos chanos TaxID=29144 RepID=A0A6J2V4L3_CHACN|nr:probable G-protein coupled receptor 158 [Chanos chanos]
MGSCATVLLLLLLPRLLPAQISLVSQTGGSSSFPTFTSIPTVSNEGSPTPDNPPSSLQTSSVAPSPEEEEEQKEEDWAAAVESYLFTSNISILASTACSRAFSLPPQRGTLPRDLIPLLRPATAALTNTANFLNLIFQASELRETSVREDLEWYHALVRAMLEGDRPDLVRRALLTFDADPTASQPQLVLRASRSSTQDILLQDLTSAWETLHPPPPAPDQSWFSALKFSPVHLPALSKRVLLNDLSTLETPKWARGDSFVTNSSGVRWADSPFLECEEGRFLPGWLLTLSVPFYGLKPDLSPEFRGVIRVDVNIQGFDVDQCATGEFWFADTHQCNRTSMVCEPIPRQGFRLGQYCCRCKEGFYSPTPVNNGKGQAGSNGSRACYPELPVCLPCWPGCDRCDDGSPCWVQEDWFLRAAVLAIQAVFMILVLVSMLMAYQHRRTKRIRASGLLLLEMILFGSLLLYFPVFILYFKPSTFRCILLRWVRLLGFAIVYGTVTLKLYRVLKVFLSRTAQRVPYMSSTSLLRMLGVMVLTVSWFLCAWTFGVLQNRDRNVPVLITSTTSDGQGFNVCDLDRWDYMMAVAELLFLCWGSSLCNAVKTVPSAFHEPRYMGIAIHNELLLSSIFHLLRFVRPSLHPDWMLLLFFTHTHVTITVTLGLLFVPKFLHTSRPVQEVIAKEVYEDEVDLRRSCSYLNSSFNSAWSDHSLDPDDIRDELKKLYSQLEVHKTKRMTNSNPHLPKKRSSCLGLGRSIIKRITDFPESLSRQCSREDKDGIRSRTQSGSYNKSLETTASFNLKNETIKQPSPILRKSCSSHDCAPQRHSSLLNSSKRSTVDKRASQYSDAESIDTTPLVCKSASAHNLTVDTNLLQPEPSRFQKSLSVIESHRGQYYLSPSRSMEDTPFADKARSGVTGPPKQDIPINEQITKALQSESFDKAEVCPWEVEEEQTGGKNQKHVTYSLSQQEDPKQEDPKQEDTKQDDPKQKALLYVCPWECVPPPAPAAAEGGDGTDGDVDASRPQAPTSASAPVSPCADFTMQRDLRVFSFRSATQRLLTAKALSVSGRSSSKDKSIYLVNTKEKKDEQPHEKVLLSASSVKLTPNLGKRTPQNQRRSMTTVGTKPCLVKQAAIRLSSVESSERSPKRDDSIQAQVCPWESEEVQLEAKKQNLSENVISRQNSSTKDKRGLSVTISTDSTKAYGYLSKPSLSVAQAEVCPWDVATPMTPKQQRQQSVLVDVCPWEVEGVEQTKSAHNDICPWETEKQDSVKAEVCPWDMPDCGTSQLKQDSKTPTEHIKPSERVIYVNTGRGGSETTEKSPKRQETIHANVCPWEAQEALKQQESGRTNVCPWESEETSSAVDKESSESTEIMRATTALLRKMSKQITITAEACPWDFPQSIPPVTEISSKEAEDTKPSQKKDATVGLSTQGSITKKANICPWETEEPEKANSQDKTQDSVSHGSPVRSTKKLDSVCVDVCPWETELPEKFKRLQSVKADICPWETNEPEKVTQRQESIRSDVCPWETEQPDKSTEKQHSSLSDLSETAEQKKSNQKQDSARVDVCPWESDEPKGAIQKQESVRADVCPWETEQPEKSPHKQESTRAGVCPWETDEANVSKGQDSARADVCPWESEQPKKSVHEQGSVKSNICPGEGGEQKTTEKQDSSHAESEGPSMSKRQDSVRTNVCPWETDTETATKTEDSHCTEISEMERTTNTEEMEKPSDSSEHTVEAEKANLPLARRDALCPWDMEGNRSMSLTEQDGTDVFTWEETIPEEEDDAETAAEAFIFPPDI